MKNFEKHCALIGFEIDWKQTVHRYPICFHDSDEAYMSDAIGSDFTLWKPGNFVCLIGSTGSGKNYFIENILIPWVIINRKTILIVSNRIANNRQIKKNVIKNMGDNRFLDYLTDDGLDAQKYLGNGIFVKSYQELTGEFLMKKSQEKFDFVILDEIQWAVVDSEFNSMTEFTLNGIIMNFKDSVRIYASATPEIIVSEIITKEFQLKKYWGFPVRGVSPCIYQIKRDFNFIDSVSGFESYSELIEPICYSKDRWLLFVDSIKKGEALRVLLENKGIETSFVHSKFKKCSNTNEEDLSYLLSHGKFKGKCLIATKAIDNGISIKDEKLRHIVTFGTEKTELLQMIGRKRIVNENDRFCLYIKNSSEREIERRFEQKLKDYHEIMSIMHGNQVLIDLAFNKMLKSDNLVKYLYSYQSRVYLNVLAIKWLFYQLTFYRDLEAIHENKKIGYMEMVFDWLEKEYVDDDVFLISCQENSKFKLMQFLDENVDAEISGTALEDFKVRFKSLVVDAFGTVYQKKTYGVSTVRKIFLNHQLPYSIETVKKDIWKIKK